MRNKTSQSLDFNNLKQSNLSKLIDNKPKYSIDKCAPLEVDIYESNQTEIEQQEKKFGIPFRFN